MGVIINPGERPWYTSPTGITFVGKTKTYQTWDDMLKEQYPGKLAWVVDASGDPTVNKGSALYTWREHQGWVKIYETESMDLDVNDVINLFVGWVANPEQLSTLYPTGKDGMFAIVGTTDTLWVWDSESQSWLDTGQDQVTINNQWDSIENKPDYFPSTFELVINESNNVTLAQTINDITLIDQDLTNRLVTVEEKINNLQISDIYGLQETLSRLKPIVFTSSWNDLVDVPTTFTPSAHKHDWTDITNPPMFSLVGHKHDWGDLVETPDFDALYVPIDINFDDRYAMLQHTHLWSDIRDVPNFAPANHNHDTVYAPIDINFDNRYSAITHTHSWEEIQDTPNFALANHNHDTVYAPRIHTHTITEVVNLQESLESLQSSLTGKMSHPTSISVGQMVVLGEDGVYIGQDIPGGDVTSEEFNNLINRVTTVEETSDDLVARVTALEEVVFEVDQLADQALDLLGYTEHKE